MKLQSTFNLENSDFQFNLHNYKVLMSDLTAVRTTEGGNEIVFTTANPAVKFNPSGATRHFLGSEPNTKLSVAPLTETTFALIFQTLDGELISSCTWSYFEIDFELI